VLVIDDEQLIRELLVEHLADEGFGVESTETIARATVRIAQQRPDAIVLDLMLPDRTGWQFLRDRRNDPLLAAIPVMVISAAPADRMLLATQLGANALLGKPFDLDQVTRVLNSIVPA
jgi:CheY-like chemotaxis protein